MDPFGWKKTSRWERASSSNCRSFLSPRWPRSRHSMHKILIVDDETGIRESLQGVLADESYETASVESGEECLKLLGEPNSMEWVLSVIGLPGGEAQKT